MKPYNRHLKQAARNLRNNSTPAEKLLWNYLRNKQINGFNFYRQKPLGDYIADFYCPKANLIIELDGRQHATAENKEYDKIREEQINNLDLAVLRFANEEIINNINSVLTTIMDKLPD